MAKRKRAGAPRQPGVAKRRLNVEITDAELRAITRTADAAGMTMSAWVRVVLRAARGEAAAGE